MNRYRKKYIPLLIAIILLSSSGIFLFTRGEAKPENCDLSLKKNRSQVLLEGKGVKFDTDRKKKFEGERKEREEKEKRRKKEEEGNQNRKEVTNENKPGKSKKPGGKKAEDKDKDTDTDTDGKDDDGKDDDDSSDEGGKETKRPRVSTSLTEGKTYSGTSLGFWVKARDFKGQTIKMNEGGDFEVFGNGTKLYSTGGSNHEKVTYKLDPLKEGNNEIRITVTDVYGNKARLSVSIRGNPGGKREEIGSVNIKIEATTLNLGILAAGEEIIYEGDQGSELIDRFLKNRGFTYDYTGTMTNGFYLKAIGKHGIARNAKIKDEIMEHLQEEGYTEKDFDPDKLGEHHFTQLSGWTYMVNGSFPNQGLSSYTPEDGDAIRLRYTLWNLYDLNGKWGNW